MYAGGGHNPDNLGFASAALGFATILGGLVNRKTPEQSEYDQLRQQSWDDFAKTVDQVNAARSHGALTGANLAGALQYVEAIMADMDAYTQRLRPALGEWVESRYHDYYDFMADVVADWKAELPTLPGGTVQRLASVFSPGGQGFGPLLLAGGFVAALLLPRGRPSKRG
jgi:hypothetical protein